MGGAQEFCSAFFFVDDSVEITEPMKRGHKLQYSRPAPSVPKFVQVFTLLVLPRPFH